MTTFADLAKPALRIAGITDRPGITPNVDQFAELIPAANRMLASWNLDGHKIFTTSIDTYPLTASKKIYTIGPGAELNGPRPLSIEQANFIFPTTPPIRRRIRVLDDDQWSRIPIQDIAGAPPWALYYDGSYDANGFGRIYLAWQPPSGYTLEIYSWQALKTDFTATTDAVILPPGYERAIVTNLAIEAASLYPKDSIVGQPLAFAAATKEAARALDAVMTLNTSCPALRSEIAAMGSGGLSGYFSAIVFGGAGGGGGGGGRVWIAPTTPPDGIRTDFVFSATPVSCSYNGLEQFVNRTPGYILVNSTTVRFVDQSGATITPDAQSIIYAEIPL